LRPRISQREAEYILEVLIATQGRLKAKQERLKELDKEVFNLWNRIKVKGIILFRDSHFKEKKLELEKLKREAFEIYLSLKLHDKLIAKYSAIAKGEPHDGRYKHLSIENVILFPKKNMLTQVLA
jgi:hypothetical protein